jgi:hypothetical protein
MMMRKLDKLRDLDTFTIAYIQCALWSTTDESTPEGGYPLDDNYDAEDLTNKALDNIIADCDAFQEDNAEDLSGLADGCCGHDFWLSRNGHGAGFWDRGYGELGNRLHKAAKVYGECNIYVHRGKLHIQ